MVLFWTLATLMVLVALAIVLVPLLRTRATPAGPSAHAAALEILRGQRQEIEADIAAGTLPAAAREEALAELVARAGDELGGEPEAQRARPAERPWIVAAAVGIAIPALAFGLYAVIGSPAASDPKVIAAARTPSDEKELAGLIENLARKVRERPDDARGWELLARSMTTLGRYREAVEAYEHLAKLVPNDAQILADWADALAMEQGRTLRGRPRELIDRALAIDPRHPKALALAATGAMDAGDLGAAMGYWQRLADVLPPDSPDVVEVRKVIAELRSRGAPAPTASAPAKGSPAANPASAVSGSVAVAPSLAAQVTGGETLFIFARAENGPRVPLAVVRTRANVLPFTFALDDSQAMAPGMNLSSALAVRVEARISRTGNATPQPGDLVGSSAVIKPGTRGVQVVVDRVLP
jgi:cytochrome c-type biogenesis protein CcmH